MLGTEIHKFFEYFASNSIGRYFFKILKILVFFCSVGYLTPPLIINVITRIDPIQFLFCLVLMKFFLSAKNINK